MPLTVQLDIDAQTDAALGALAGRLARRDRETVRELGDVHHVSLGVYGELPLEDFIPKLAAFAQATSPIPIQLAYVGLFAGPPSVLYLGPAVTVGLLGLHQRFHAAFADFSGRLWEHYRPGAWVPHVTLAMAEESGKLVDGINDVLRLWQPGPASLVGLRLIEFRPVRTLFYQAL